MRLNKKWILIISIVLISFLLMGCSEGGDDGTPTVEVSPEGTERFHPENVEEYGCPDPEKVPVWEEIPECEGK